MATWYVDYVNGNNSNAGTSWGAAFATLAGATAAKGVVSTDTIEVAKTGDAVRVQTAGGTNVSATFTNLSATVTLDNAATLNINTCDSAWTADNGSTVSTSGTVLKEGLAAATITTTTTAQRQAHAATVATDYSAYTGISFWIRSSANQSASVIRIDLCSDTAGATPVNSFTVPISLSVNQFVPIYIDFGGALSNSIQSVALVTLSGIAAATITLDNIIACTSKLHLCTLISKDSATVISSSTDGWWPIRSINSTTVSIEAGINASGTTASQGYYGTTETVAIYSRAFQMRPTTANDVCPVSGVTISGGWNTSSGLQDGETIIGSNASTGNFTVSTSQTVTRLHSYGGGGSASLPGVTINDGSFTGMAVCSQTIGVTGGTSSASATVNVLFAACCITNAVNISGSAIYYSSVIRAFSCRAGGVAVTSGSLIMPANAILTSNNHNGVGINLGTFGLVRCGVGASISAISNTSSGVRVTYILCYGTITVQNNLSNGLSTNSFGSGFINRVVTSNNGGNGIVLSGCTRLAINSCNISDSTKFTIAAVLGTSAYVQKYQDTSGDTRIFDSLGAIQSDTTTRHTASGYSWKLQPNSSASSTAPLEFPLQPIAVDNTSTSFKVYVNRSNTATLVAGVKYNGGDLIGANTDQSATGVAAANTWEQLSITVGAGSEATGGFTPIVYAYGDSSNPAYFDDASAT